jgi:hypothetical protein
VLRPGMSGRQSGEDVKLAPSGVRAGFTEGTIDGMRTQTIERTETDERVDDGTDSDIPKYFHYVKKDKIAESAVMGTHVVALCGEVFPVTKSAKPGSPVCPECKRIFEKLKT